MAIQPVNRFLLQGATLEKLIKDLQDYEVEIAAKIKTLTDSNAALQAQIDELKKGT